MKTLYKLFILPMLFFAACKRENCFGEAGAIISVTRAATAFHQIDVYDNIDLVLTQDTVEKIEIAAPQHLEPNISAQIENGILTLKNNATCTGLRKASEKITAYVHLKKLDRIIYAGIGNITSTNTLIVENMTFYSEAGAGNIDVSLNAVQTFAYIMDENADFIFHGNSGFCYTYTASRGSIDLSDFVVKKLSIEYGGVRDAKINVTEELTSIIYFKGNLYYRGNAKITKNEVHSSGRLIRLF